MRWVKSKAISMITIVVCAIFSISFLAPETSAAQVCCEKTKVFHNGATLSNFNGI